LHNKIFRPYIRERAAAVICKTQQASHFLENRGYLNTHVLPVGLDFSRFNQRVDHDWRATLNIGPDARIVLYVGSLEDRRNPDFMISLARAAGEQTFFLIVGSGPWESRVAAASADIENLIYIGTLNQKELPSLYEQSDVFILPSNYEIYGMVVIESLYFGTPVVSSRTAGPTDILETETFGTILDTLDVEGWLAAIGRTELKSGSDAGAHERSQYASQKFDWRNIATRYIDIVENPERSVR